VNVAVRFLDANRDRLGLAEHGIRGGMSSAILTPRFESSRHVVFLVVPDGESKAALVAKVPRLDGDGAGLAREAAALDAANRARRSDHPTIPRVVAFEEFEGRPILVETALSGPPMDRLSVSRRRSRCIAAVLEWLDELPRLPAERASAEEPSWYERLVARPLRRFAARFATGGEEAELVARTLEELEPLAASDLPLVLEHGDLSDPNLIWTDRRRVGVVDWELARERGLPGQDLFFFLSYAAFAPVRTEDPEPLVAAFERAFCGSEAWAREPIEMYAQRIELAPHVLRPLFVACWARYAAALVDRVAAPSAAGDEERAPPVDAALGRWLRDNRYFVLWRHALDGAAELCWAE
jgi:aminoglycoside phosphotransferase (APT) family kinase protein